MTKKILTLFVTLVFTLTALTACGDTDSTDSNTDGNTDANVSAEAEADTSDKVYADEECEHKSTGWVFEIDKEELTCGDSLACTYTTGRRLCHDCGYNVYPDSIYYYSHGPHDYDCTINDDGTVTRECELCDEQTTYVPESVEVNVLHDDGKEEVYCYYLSDSNESAKEAYEAVASVYRDRFRDNLDVGFKNYMVWETRTEYFNNGVQVYAYYICLSMDNVIAYADKLEEYVEDIVCELEDAGATDEIATLEEYAANVDGSDDAEDIKILQEYLEHLVSIGSLEEKILYLGL